MNKQIGILAVLAGVLLSGALLATPSLKVTNAQGNQSAGMQTQATQGSFLDEHIIISNDNVYLS